MTDGAGCPLIKRLVEQVTATPIHKIDEIQGGGELNHSHSGMAVTW